MSDNGVVLAYLLRRWFRASHKANAIHSVRGPNGQWRHTMVDRARVWALTIELGPRVVRCWLRREEAA